MSPVRPTRLVVYSVAFAVWIAALCFLIPAGLNYEAQHYLESNEVSALQAEVADIKSQRRVFEVSALKLMDENELLRQRIADLENQLSGSPVCGGDDPEIGIVAGTP